MSTNKTTAGAVVGAAVGLGVGVAVGGATKKERRKNAMTGAAAGTAVGALAGAGLEYIDREISENHTLLSNRTHSELAKIKARLHALEEETNSNYQLIGKNSREMRLLQTRHENYDHEMQRLVDYSIRNESRAYSTSEAIREINIRIDDKKRDDAPEDNKLRAELERKRNELESQNAQLLKQKMVIAGLLKTLNQQNQKLSNKS